MEKSPAQVGLEPTTSKWPNYGPIFDWCFHYALSNGCPSSRSSLPQCETTQTSGIFYLSFMKSASWRRFYKFYRPAASIPWYHLLSTNNTRWLPACGCSLSHPLQYSYIYKWPLKTHPTTSPSRIIRRRPGLIWFVPSIILGSIVDIFHVFAETSFLWQFSHLPTFIFKSASHPTKLILRKISRVSRPL